MHTGMHRNSMCPAGRDLEHPAGGILQVWATYGCPTKTGKPWTREVMTEAVQQGPHQSAMTPEALQHFAVEADKKVKQGQARIMMWDDIKDNPPQELKISPVAVIPHKSKAY